MTLVELLVAIAILSLILFPIYEFLRQGAASWEVGENRTEVMQNARVGIKKVTRELKGALSVYSMSASSIRFWARDKNNDDVADPDEIVTFNWDGTPPGELTRKLDSESTASPAAEYVDDFEMTFLDADGNVTNTPGDVKLVTVLLHVKKSSRDHDYTTILRSGADLRNISKSDETGKKSKK